MIYAVIDVETTGGSPKHSKITEVSIFKTDGTNILAEYTTLVHPEQKIPEFIVRLTGISDAMVENSPKFYEIAKDIVEFTSGCIFVAHNAAFDYGMMRAEYKRIGYDYRLPQMCTVKASRKVIPGHASYSLGTLCKDLKIKLKERHRAAGDARATVELFHLIYQKTKQNISAFIQYEVNPKMINSNFNLDLLDEIPNKIGVYLFYNEYNNIVYIGKSIHLRSRIEQHLRNTKSAKGLKMLKDIVRVEYEITGSELIAMLKESELIKKHKPIFNRRLRKSIFPYGVYDELNKTGYLELNVQKIDDNEVLPLQYFDKKKEANAYLNIIVEKYQLCQKLCSVYKTDSSCFHYTIAQCKGACLGEESASAYNKRVQKYIDETSMDDNSYLIIEKGRTKLEKSIVWIEKGHVRGFGYAPFHFNGEKNLHSLKRYVSEIKEDKDSKMIVKSYFKKVAKSKIVPL